ncbi:MAG: hypothetical protein NC930_09470, partial [Candidatus Omnitrophica bacterium]|nr:hypothetical protein [Candidatus Omnitrophota bacterium]
RELKEEESGKPYAGRLRGIDISGAEPFEGPATHRDLSRVLIRLDSFWAVLSALVFYVYQSVSIPWIRRLYFFCQKKSVSEEFHLRSLAGHLRALKQAGYVTTTHLGDFTGAVPSDNPLGHAAFVSAHLDILGPYLDRIGHGRVLTPYKIRIEHGHALPVWKKSPPEMLELLRQVQSLGLTVETASEGAMRNFVLLRDNYPNFWWYEPAYRLKLAYGTDGVAGRYPTSLSQHLARLLLASPTPRHPSLGRTRGITVREMRNAVLDERLSDVSRTEVRSGRRVTEEQIFEIIRNGLEGSEIKGKDGRRYVISVRRLAFDQLTVSLRPVEGEGMSPVAVIDLMTQIDSGGGLNFLSAFWTARGHRKNGLISRTLDHLAKIFSEKYHDKVMLHSTIEDDESLLQLYDALPLRIK